MSIIEKAAERLYERSQRATLPHAAIRETVEEPQLRTVSPPTKRTRSSNTGKDPAKINLSHLHGLGMVTPNQGKTVVAQEFRVIKRPLINNAFKLHDEGRNGNLITVTSALPKEGKSFCAINLAMSIAMEMDHTVLLVDADVTHPSVLSTLGLEGKGGLTDLLLDENRDPAEFIIKTDVDTLSILPAGEHHEHLTELFASHTMSQLLDQLANRYNDRIVIFDSSPLLVTTEAQVLACQMGQIVVVVEADTTTQQALKRAIAQLDGCPNISLLYNKAKASSGGNYSYYSA